MFGIGETELVIIVVFAFLLFGPDKLPGMGRTLGRVLRQFREASDGFTEVVQTNIMDPASEELEKSPKQRKREAAVFEEDADVEQAAGDEERQAPRRETFAERKARLKAEREAAAVQAVVADEDDGGDGDVYPTVDVDSDEDLPVGEDVPAEPARTRAADLYSLTQKSSRSQAALQDASAATASQQPGEEDGSAEA